MHSDVPTDYQSTSTTANAFMVVVLTLHKRSMLAAKSYEEVRTTRHQFVGVSGGLRARS
jgi:hypothetical protein